MGVAAKSMNIFQEIKTLFTVRSVVEEIIKEMKMPTVSAKPGWKTSEFWFNLAGQAAVLFGAIKGFIPAQWAAIITVAGTAIYTVARTIAKAVADIQIAKASTATVSTTAPVTTVTTPA